MQQLDRTQRRRAGRHGAELESVEEQRPQPVQHRPGTDGQSRKVHLIRTGQAFGFGDARHELFPTNGGHDGAVQVGVCLLGRDQGSAQLGEQAHLIVGGTGVTKDSVFLACLGAAERATDRAVEQADAVIGQASGGVQHGCDQGRPAAKQRECAQVLGGKAPTLAGELAQPLRMHAFGAGWIEADGAQAGQLLDHALEGLVAWCAGRLPCPGQHAHRGAVFGCE